MSDPRAPGSETNAGRLPNFFCIGAPRAGTTWLFESLNRHPEAFIPQLKELSYFIRSEYRSNVHRGEDWYRSLFVAEEKPRVEAWGDISPRYYYQEDTPLLIQRVIPDAKFILLVRHPVEMLYSLYVYHANMYPRTIDPRKYDFNDYLNHHLVERLGFFARHLKRYRGVFSHDRVLARFAEDLRKSPQQEFAEICRFLGIDDGFELPGPRHEVNTAMLPRRFMLSTGLQFLTAKTRLDFFEKIDERFNRVRYRDYSPRHLITPVIFDRLMAIYEHDVHELERVEGRELAEWFDFESLDPSIRAPIGTAG